MYSGGRIVRDSVIQACLRRGTEGSLDFGSTAKLSAVFGFVKAED